MKTTDLFTLTYFLLVLCTPTCSQNTSEIHGTMQESPLRASEPVDTIIADLKTFIPKYLNDEHIPGASIALMYGGEIAWTVGFGVANTLTREKVTSNTLFEVASISKVVTAYMALRLVDEGKLSVDKPLHSYLSKEWLPPSAYRDSIALKHVLSHSSGLSKTSKDIMFRPGTAYYYSAQGFNYVKEVLEEVTGEPFEKLAQRLVFEPLGMNRSSFIRQENLIPSVANGHIRAIVPAVLFSASFTAIFAIVVLMGTIITRLLTKSWKLKRSHIIGFLVTSFILLAFALFVLLGSNGMMEFALFMVTSGLVMLIMFLLLFYAGRKFIVKKVPTKKGIQRLLSAAWSTLIILAILFITTKINNLPVPRWPEYQASPAGTLRTSAPELALFMKEISQPKFLKAETAEYLRTPQIKLSRNLSWGMGPGILYPEQGYALWQWGQHIDFQSIMIAYPDREFGVVICTNNDLLSPDVPVEIAHRALGGVIEPLRRAIHLQYDYTK